MTILQIFKHVGMQPSRRERFTMLVIVGSNGCAHCLMIEDGNGCKTQDFQNSVAARFPDVIKFHFSKS